MWDTNGIGRFLGTAPTISLPTLGAVLRLVAVLVGVVELVVDQRVDLGAVQTGCRQKEGEPVVGMKYWSNAGFLALDQLVPIALAAESLGFAGSTLPDYLFVPEAFSSKYPYSADGGINWPADAPRPDSWVAYSPSSCRRSRWVQSGPRLA